MKSYNTPQSESKTNSFTDFFKDIFTNKKKLIILTSIILFIIIIIIVIVVVSTKSDKKEYKNECGVPDEIFKITIKELEEHNKYRKEHHVDYLTINCELMDIAQNYSKYLHEKNIFKHSNAKFHGKYMGENLFMISSSNKIEYEPPMATKMWYDEIVDYDFKTHKSKNGKAIGHFTQVIWKDTKEIGVGVTCSNRCYVVANYYPAGNIIGEFGENVLSK